MQKTHHFSNEKMDKNHCHPEWMDMEGEWALMRFIAYNTSANRRFELKYSWLKLEAFQIHLMGHVLLTMYFYSESERYAMYNGEIVFVSTLCMCVSVRNC